MVIRNAEERKTLDRFAKKHRFCWACGINPKKQRDLLHDEPRKLEIHHIAKHLRLHEVWNLSRLCQLCHRVAEGERVKYEGVVIPALKAEHVFWLKQHFDRKNFDLQRIRDQWRVGLPNDPIPIPGWFQRQHTRFRGGS